MPPQERAANNGLLGTPVVDLSGMNSYPQGEGPSSSGLTGPRPAQQASDSLARSLTSLRQGVEKLTAFINGATRNAESHQTAAATMGQTARQRIDQIWTGKTSGNNNGGVPGGSTSLGPTRATRGNGGDATFTRLGRVDSMIPGPGGSGPHSPWGGGFSGMGGGGLNGGGASFGGGMAGGRGNGGYGGGFSRGGFGVGAAYSALQRFSGKHTSDYVAADYVANWIGGVSNASGGTARGRRNAGLDTIYGSGSLNAIGFGHSDVIGGTQTLVQSSPYLATTPQFARMQTQTQALGAVVPTLGAQGAANVQAQLGSASTYYGMRGIGVQTLNPGGTARAPGDVARQVAQRVTGRSTLTQAQAQAETAVGSGKVWLTYQNMVRSGALTQESADAQMDYLRRFSAATSRGVRAGDFDRLNVEALQTNKNTSQRDAARRTLGDAANLGTSGLESMKSRATQQRSLDRELMPGFIDGLTTANQLLTNLNEALTNLLHTIPALANAIGGSAGFMGQMGPAAIGAAGNVAGMVGAASLLRGGKGGGALGKLGGRLGGGVLGKGAKMGLKGGLIGAGAAVAGNVAGGAISGNATRGSTRSKLGHVVSGAATGAGIGMIFGPEGAVVGGVLGGIWGAATGGTNTTVQGRGPNTVSDIEALLQGGPPFKVTSTTGGGHASGSYHYTGNAIDVVGPSGGHDNNELLGLNKWAAKYGPGLEELIYAGPGGINLKSGKAYTYDAAIRAEHHNHVHIAATKESLSRIGKTGAGYASGASGVSVDNGAANIGSSSAFGAIGTGAYGSVEEVSAVMAALSGGGARVPNGSKSGSASTGSSAGTTNGANAGGTAPSGTLNDWITAGLALAGKPASWAKGMYQIAMHESGGRNIPQGISDQNSRAGTPAFGPFQMIEPTFRSYAVKGHTDWHNPVDEAAADANYIAARYGNPYNTPGLKSIGNGGGYKGYAVGSWEIVRDEIAKLHKGEMVLPETTANAVRAAVANGGGGGSKSIVLQFQPGSLVFPAVTDVDTARSVADAFVHHLERNNRLATIAGA